MNSSTAQRPHSDARDDRECRNSERCAKRGVVEGPHEPVGRACRCSQCQKRGWDCNALALSHACFALAAWSLGSCCLVVSAGALAPPCEAHLAVGKMGSAFSRLHRLGHTPTKPTVLLASRALPFLAMLVQSDFTAFGPEAIAVSERAAAYRGFNLNQLGRFHNQPFG